MAEIKKKKKSNIKDTLLPLAYGVAGGFIANRASVFLETQPFMVGKESLAPLAVGALGIGASMFLEGDLKMLGFGASVVSITEYVENTINDVSKKTVQGQFNNSMGFVSRMRDGQDQEGVTTLGDGAIR